MEMETETNPKRNRNWNSNRGKPGNTETSFMVKSFSIYNHKSPKRNIRVWAENYGWNIVVGNFIKV